MLTGRPLTERRWSQGSGPFLCAILRVESRVVNETRAPEREMKYVLRDDVKAFSKEKITFFFFSCEEIENINSELPEDISLLVIVI